MKMVVEDVFPWDMLTSAERNYNEPRKNESFVVGYLLYTLYKSGTIL